MKKNEREMSWKATSKLNTSKNNDDDIFNLNDDETFAPIEEEEKEPLSDEEKKEIRKKLFFLLIIIVLVLAGLLIVLIANPFQNNDSKKQENEEEVVDAETEKPKETLPETPIKELENGAVSLTNLQLQTLVNEIVVNSPEFYENNTVSMYLNDNIDITALTDQNKLFLLSKTNDFKLLLEKQIIDNQICNTNLNVTKNDIDKILNDRFNTTITNYNVFTYTTLEEQGVKFTNQNGTYVGNCHTFEKLSESYSQQKVISATKKDNQLYVDAKVVFINKSGVYKEPTFNTLITNVSQHIDDIIGQGNTYRYTYNINNDTFVLTNISLQK